MIDIYKIENNINKKVYIGQTCRGYKTRFEQHINDSKKYNYDLYKAFKKYGLGNFMINKINVCKTPELAKLLERHYIKKFDSYKNGYNMNKGDKVVYKHSEETKNKMSLSKLGKVSWTKKWKVTTPNDNTVIIYNLADYCRKNKLNRGNMSSLANNKISYYKNYNVREINAKSNRL